MSSQREERLVKAWGKPLIVGLGAGSRTPNQLSDSIKELREWGIELTKEEEKEARDIALQKRDKRKEFLASFKKVLEKVRIKESEMTKTDGLTEEQRRAVEILKKGLPKEKIREIFGINVEKSGLLAEWKRRRQEKKIKKELDRRLEQIGQ